MPRTAGRSTGWKGLLPVLFCSFLLGFVPARAADVDSLYSAEVSVPTQTDDARDAGIRAALEAVLIKLTGDRAIASRPNVAGLLSKAGAIVQQYRFHELTAAQEGIAPPLRLWAAFDSNAIMSFLQDAAIPVWGRSRPSVLLWAVIEDGGTRTVFDPGMRAEAKTAVEERAEQRGLPLIFPLWDLDDQRALSPADLWGNFTDTIQKASARYRTNAVLVGRIFKRGTSDWAGRWTLYEASGRYDWEASATSMAEAIATGLDGSADNMTKRYAQVMSPDQSEQVDMIVTGVDSLARYGKLIQYLEGLDGVAKVRVTSLDDMRLTLALQLRGSRDGLARLIALGDVMVRQDSGLIPVTSSGAVAERESLVYRMLP